MADDTDPGELVTRYRLTQIEAQLGRLEGAAERLESETNRDREKMRERLFVLEQWRMDEERRRAQEADKAEWGVGTVIAIAAVVVAVVAIVVSVAR